MNIGSGKRVGVVVCAVVCFSMGLSSSAISDDAVPDSASQEGETSQQVEVEGALERARDALQSAVQSLSEAGRLAMDEQLPKLKKKADALFSETKTLLDGWGEEIERRLEEPEEPKEPEEPEEPDSSASPPPPSSSSI